jgi:hypothetical protein
MSQKRSPKPRARAIGIYLDPTTAFQPDRQRRILDAIALKRRQPNISMTEAARRSGTTLKTIRRWAGTALETRDGRLTVRATDRIARDLRFLTEKGQIVVRVTNSRDATRVARYNNAVRRFLLHGDVGELRRFHGKTLRVRGAQHAFVTDPRILNRLARAGEVHFLDIYATPGDKP